MNFLSAAGARYVLGIAFVALLVLIGPGKASAAPIAVGTYAGSTYELYLVAGGINWDTASALTISRGGILAVMETSAENVYVAGLVAANVSLYNRLGLGPWIGGFSPSSSAAFQWVNGAAFNSFPAPWQSGQPDWAEASPMGLLYYNGGALSGSNWGDYGQACGVTGAAGCYAGIVNGYVVELPVPEPGSLLLLGTGLAVAVAARRRFAKRT